ncbi:conserved Plasmodium protein, unknown function [Plasmodium relictum]|uniref:TOG domain-containing protein n=1 Tax=Plasmodium relictum TaxID=85471 RepID=A0A1J1HC80_PLARL|nr:conserved Plasmodium protein, unknown function [Plasmodium relictum]CRH01177.1 conserved Plasmodium protein, unknown function [Plasmodium relictum]
MENRKFLRIGKSVVHGRKGPLRGEIENDEEDEKKKRKNIDSNNILNNNKNKEIGKEEIKNENKNLDKTNSEDILNSHYKQNDNEHSSGDIFEQLLQRELAKGALGGGVVEKNINKPNVEKKDNFNKNENKDEEIEDLSNIDLCERINSTIVKYRMHGYNEILRCFTDNNINKKIEIVNSLFKDEDCILKYISDSNLICQLKTTEITEEYLNVIKDIFFYNFKEEYENEEALINSFVNEYRNKLYNLYTKIHNILCEKILTNVKSFDNGFNIIRKIIEYCSSDKITLNIITMLCEHLNLIYIKANKNVSNIKGIKIKVVSSELLLFYKLLNYFGPNIVCVKTINKYCLKFNEMLDKTVKTNFYLLYIEILSLIKNSEFQNSILSELNSQQKNYISKELQKENRENIITKKKGYLINQSSNNEQNDNYQDVFTISENNLIEENDIFKEICTKQWERRVLEGFIDKSSNNNNTSLSNENLLPWKIKVEAINLLCDKLKSKYSIKKTSYVSTILSIISKLLKNESALPVVVSTLKLLHILIEKFEKDIYNTVKTFSFILCSKLKDSNKQVSNACMECLTKAIAIYNIDIFIDDLSKNLKDKNNNTRMVTLDFILKIFHYIDKKNIISIIEITKHLLNDNAANIKNTAFKVYSLIIANYGENVHPSFFNTLPSNKKKSILSLCTTSNKKNNNDENIDSLNHKNDSELANKSLRDHNNDLSNNNTINDVNDNLEVTLPENIINNLVSNNYSSKIEALNLLNEWLKLKIHFTTINLENLINLIKKNCYDFKGKYNQLNIVIYDFFNNFIDLLYHFNINNINNPHFMKILNILMCLYIDKATDKKENIICNNFINKCFNYFDNNIIIDIIIKNCDAKNTKKCEECIKILQKIFLTKNSNSNVNVKNLIYFLKKFVDSKNSNLRNSSILMLQILCKNFGDRYVLSYLEGISENIRQAVKLKEDAEKFILKQGLNSSSALIKNNDKNNSNLNNSNTKINEKIKKQNISTAKHDDMNKEEAWKEKKNNDNHYSLNNMNEERKELHCFEKNNTLKIEESSKLHKIEIDYTNTYLNYNNSKIIYNQENLTNEIIKDSKLENLIRTNEKVVEEKFNLKKKIEHIENDEEKEEDDEEERMTNISEIIKQYINNILNENNNNNNNIANNTSKIINIIEKIGKYYINPDKLDILINNNTLNKIYNSNKSKCIRLLYVLLFSLRENVHIYADILFEFIMNIIDDMEISIEHIDKLLTCLCRNLGISKYISHINNYILNEKLNNIKEDNKNIKKINKRNKILIIINNININHILLLNENIIKKKVLKFYLDLFFDDNKQIREKSSIVLDNIYSKYGGTVFFYIYEKLSVHKKECLHDILNQMKSNKEEFSFYKILLSNNSQLKRISANESNLSVTSAVTKPKSVKRLSSFNKNKIMKIEFPPYYKIKPDKLKWDKNFDQSHSNYLMKEFKSFTSNELLLHMFSENANMINRSILFFKDYLSNSSNQSILFSKSGLLDLLLKWILFSLNENQNDNELLCASTDLIRIVLKTIEDNYVFINEQELIILLNFIFDKINTSSSEIRKKLKEILLCLCYTSDHKLYFSLLLKNLTSCDQKRMCDSLDIILKLIILYKDKCLNYEKDIMKILQVFTLYSKNKNVTIYCLKIFANIQAFYPNFYRCIENDEISYYLKSKVDEFIEKCPDYNINFKDIENDENNSSYQSDNSEENLKDEENIAMINYIKNNANQRASIKKEVEGHVNEFNKNVEEILEIKKKIEEIEINKINEDYINNQISYTSISNNLNFNIDGNNYSKSKELFHILESKNNEKIEGSNHYNNSIIYFKFVYLASFLYSNDIETISKVCKLIVDNIVQVGKKSKNGNFILTENGNYIFKNFNLFIILIKGANYALRYLFQKNFGKDLKSSFIHFNAILSAVLLVDILMKKKSCIAKLSFDHFSFFFINTIVCLSIYTKVIHTNKYIYLFKNGDIARSLVTSILNNLLGREFLTNHSKLLEYVCNVSFNLGFDIMKNNKILIDDLSDTSEFYIYINTYIKILNKIYKKIINKIYEENSKENNFVYRILHILFLNLSKYDIYLCKIEKEKRRKRKIENESDEKCKDIDSNAFYNKKICNEKNSDERDMYYHSDYSIYSSHITYYENLNVDNKNDISVKIDYEENKDSINIKKEKRQYSEEEIEKINKNKMDFMNKYLFFIQLIFYGIRKNNPLILLAYIYHEIIKNYNDNLVYYYKKIELLLNKDLRNCVGNINVNFSPDFYSLNFSFEEFLNEYNYLKEKEFSIFNSYKNIFSLYANFDSEIIYNNFDLSIDDIIQKKRDFLESLKMININEISFNNNQFENLKETIIEYINELENTDILNDIQNNDFVSDYNFLCMMYRIPKSIENNIASNEKEEITNNNSNNNIDNDNNNKYTIKSIEENKEVIMNNEKNINKEDLMKNQITEQTKDNNNNNNNIHDGNNREEKHIFDEKSKVNFSNINKNTVEDKIENKNSNELTFISHNIFLRNQTIENVDMNTLRNKYTPINNFSSSIIKKNEKKIELNGKNNIITSSEYNTQSLTGTDVVREKSQENNKCFYDKKDYLNIFNNKFNKNDEINENKFNHHHNDHVNYKKEKDVINVDYNQNKTCDYDKMDNKEYSKKINTMNYEKQNMCDYKDQIHDNNENKNYDDSHYKNILNNEIKNEDCQKKMNSEYENKIYKDNKIKNDNDRRYCYKERKIQDGLNEIENKYKYDTNIKNKELLYNVENEKKSNEEICKSKLSTLKKNTQSYKEEKENETNYLLKEKSNEKFKIYDDSNVNILRNTNKSFLRSKTDVKALVNKYENQKGTFDRNSKASYILLHKKKLENISNNSNLNKTKINKMYNKLPSHLEKKKNCVYERSASSTFDCTTKTDKLNLTSEISPDNKLKDSSTKKNFLNNYIFTKNENKISSNATNSNSSSSINNKKNDSKSNTPSNSTKRKNFIGISFPLKKKNINK